MEPLQHCYGSRQVLKGLNMFTDFGAKITFVGVWCNKN
jgi:hypothetical protein